LYEQNNNHDINLVLKQRIKELENDNVAFRKRIKSYERITQKLHRSEQRYRRLNKIYPVGIFHTDPQGRNTYLNPKGCEIKGILSSEARGYGWMKYVHPDDKKRILRAWADGLEKVKPVQAEFRFVHNDKITWVNGQTVPEYDEAGNLIGYIGVLTDITQQRIIENLINQDKNRLAHVSRTDSIKEAISGIAHQLNQPLTAVSNFVSGCERRLKSLYGDELPVEIISALHEANAQAQRAGDIIHSLKNLLCKGEINKQWCNINTIITNMIGLVNESIKQADIEINLKLDENLPEINCDKTQIEQVILNLINNAVDAISDKRIKTRIMTIKTAFSSTDEIQISIADSGIGIQKDMLDKIFVPFVSSKPQGMGIGLSLCYNIIQRHNGQIFAESSLGAGSIFKIIFPINKSKRYSNEVS